MSEEAADLREEVARLRRDVNHLLMLLDQRDDPDFPRPEYPVFEGEKLAVRCDKMRIPFLVNATEDGAELAFMDKNNRERFVIGIGKDSAYLELRNAEGKMIAQLAEATDGSGQFCVCDEEGKPRAGMRVSMFGGLVNALDSAGKPMAVLVGKDDGGEIFVANDHHHMAAKMTAGNRGGVITVHETSGEIMGSLSADGNTGGVIIHGPLGFPAVGLIASDDGGAILINDAEGKNKRLLP